MSCKILLIVYSSSTTYAQPSRWRYAMSMCTIPMKLDLAFDVCVYGLTFDVPSLRRDLAALRLLF